MKEVRRLPVSHASAALGLAPWSTPLATYQSAREGRTWDPCPEEPPKAFKLVPALREWASAKAGIPFKSVSQVFAGGKRLPFVTSQPHGVASDLSAALLLKTPRDLSRWFEETEEGEERMVMPRDVAVEAALVRLVVAPQVVVGVLVGGDLRIVSQGQTPVLVDDELVHLLTAFWDEVKEGQAPPAQQRDEKLLRELFPTATLPMLKWSELTDEQRDRVEAWATANSQFNNWKKETEKTRPAVVDLLNAHSGIMFDGGRPTSLTSLTFEARAPSIQGGGWKAVAQEFLDKLSDKKQEAVLKRHTPKEGPRVLRAHFNAVTRVSDPVQPSEKGAAA